MIKILLVSNVQDALDKVMDSLNSDGATVVAKEISSDAKTLAARSSTMFANGGYDMMIVIVDNPIAANMAFNKFEGANAAVCSDADDAKTAKANDANVIIIKDPQSEEIPQMLNALLRKPGMFGGSKPKPMKMAAQQVEQVAAPQPMQAPQPKSGFSFPSLGQNNNAQPQKAAPPQKPAMQKQAAPVQKQQMQQNYVPGPKRSGVMGWIKDELGIIDNTPPPTPPAKQRKDKGK